MLRGSRFMTPETRNLVRDNLIRGNCVRLIKLNVFHNNNTVLYTIIYNNLLNIDIIYCVIYIRIITVYL